MKDSPAPQGPTLANILGIQEKPVPLDAKIRRVAGNIGGTVFMIALCAVLVLLVIKMGFWVFS